MRTAPAEPSRAADLVRGPPADRGRGAPPVIMEAEAPSGPGRLARDRTPRLGRRLPRPPPPARSRCAPGPGRGDPGAQRSQPGLSVPPRTGLRARAAAPAGPPQPLRAVDGGGRLPGYDQLCIRGRQVSGSKALLEARGAPLPPSCVLPRVGLLHETRPRHDSAAETTREFRALLLPSCPARRPGEGTVAAPRARPEGALTWRRGAAGGQQCGAQHGRGQQQRGQRPARAPRPAHAARWPRAASAATLLGPALLGRKRPLSHHPPALGPGGGARATAGAERGRVFRWRGRSPRPEQLRRVLVFFFVLGETHRVGERGPRRPRAAAPRSLTTR